MIEIKRLQLGKFHFVAETILSGLFAFYLFLFMLLVKDVVCCQMANSGLPVCLLNGLLKEVMFVLKHASKLVKRRSHHMVTMTKQYLSVIKYVVHQNIAFFTQFGNTSALLGGYC